MNSEMVKMAIKTLFDDGSFEDDFLREARERQAKRQEFRQSDRFHEMCDAIRKQSKKVYINSVSASYLSESTIKDAGWDFATKEDVDGFFSAITSLFTAPEEDEDFDYSDYEFIAEGLHVSVLHGQGTSITVSNDIQV